MKPLIFISLFLFVSQTHSQWLERKAEGWAWYEDRLKEQALSKPVEQPQVSAQDKIISIRKELEEKLAVALLHPSEENLATYMEEQRQWIEQSARFSHAWAKLLLRRPDLDTTIENPDSQYGIQLKKKLALEHTNNLIASLADEHGLFFFYEGDSKISQALTKIVKAFSSKHGWEVIPISTDGVLLPEFRNSKLDNGITKQFEIDIFPALFVINPSNKTAVPVAFGLVSVDQIEENIVMQFQEEARGKND